KAHRVALFFVPSRTRGWCAGRRWCGTPHHLRAAFRGTPRDTFERRLAPNDVGRAPPGAPTAAFARVRVAQRVPGCHPGPHNTELLYLGAVSSCGSYCPPGTGARISPGAGGTSPDRRTAAPRSAIQECPREDARRGARVSKP